MREIRCLSFLSQRGHEHQPADSNSEQNFQADWARAPVAPAGGGHTRCRERRTVDVRGIVLVGGAPAGLENFAACPLALQDVLGRPVVHRVLERLKAHGVTDTVVVSPAAMPPLSRACRRVHGEIKFLHVGEAQLWRAAETVFTDHAQAGAEEVLVLRLGGYAEFVVEEFLQYHLDSRARVTRAVLPGGSELDVVLIAASRRNDAAYLFRHQLRASRMACHRWPLRGYWNPLETAADLRALALDALMQRIALSPAGQQIRPGIWAAAVARIDGGARVLAPAFIGERARVRAGAVITRGSVLEHHAEVASGTVIEDSTILPYSYVGASLDVAHSVVGGRRLAHLSRNLEMEVADPKLIDTVLPHAPLRILTSAASLAALLPAQMLRRLFVTSHREPPTELPAAVGAPSAALQPPGFEASDEASSFPANVMVARRYGDQ